MINYGKSQDRCVDGMCDLEERRSGCVMCSGDGKCLTCGSGYVLFDGHCVDCLPMEECVFNNSVEVECVNGEIKGKGKQFYNNRNLKFEGEYLNGKNGMEKDMIKVEI